MKEEIEKLADDYLCNHPKFGNSDYINLDDVMEIFEAGYQKAMEAQKRPIDDLIESLTYQTKRIKELEQRLEAQNKPAMSLDTLLKKHNIDAGLRGKEKLTAFAQEYANQFREEQKCVAPDKAKLIDAYIKQKHTQEECIGFIDGLEVMASLLLPSPPNKEG